MYYRVFLLRAFRLASESKPCWKSESMFQCGLYNIFKIDKFQFTDMKGAIVSI